MTRKHRTKGTHVLCSARTDEGRGQEDISAGFAEKCLLLSTEESGGVWRMKGVKQSNSDKGSA